MIVRIIIVQHRFCLTTPKTQRMLAAAKSYLDYGIEVFFVYSSHDEESPNELYPNIHFIQIPEHGRIDIRSYLKFIKVIKSVYNKNSVILFYDLPYYSFIFNAKNYNVFAEVTEVPLFGKQSSIIKKLLSILIFKAAQGFSGLLVISKSLEEYFSKKNVKNIQVINMFVDKSRFEGLTKKTNEKYVGYCGTISTHKDGVDDLIRAFSILSKKYPYYKLYLFGRFESDTVKEVLMHEIDDLQLSSKVIFTGPVASSEMPQKLMDASILALARPANLQAQYGFPTKLGEYLATGNPVVLTKVGDIPLFLNDNENAFLVEPNDYHAFAKKLIWVVEHPEDAEHVAKSGKELVETDFSSKTQIKKAIDFFERI